MGWGDRYKEPECPDGTKRYILKDLKDIPIIFSEYFPEWNAKINTGLNITRGIVEANAGFEVAEEAKKVYDNISNLNQSAIIKFKTSYMSYCTNPCGKDKVLDDAVTQINSHLDEMDKQLSYLETIKNTPQPSDTTVGSDDPRLSALDVVGKELMDMANSF